MPLVGVMTYLTHIHGESGLVAEVDIVFDSLFGSRSAIPVAGVHDVVVELPVGKHIEITIPPGAA